MALRAIDCDLIRGRHADPHLRFGIVHEGRQDDVGRVASPAFGDQAVDAGQRRIGRQGGIRRPVVQPLADLFGKDQRQAGQANEQQEQRDRPDCSSDESGPTRASGCGSWPRDYHLYFTLARIARSMPNTQVTLLEQLAMVFLLVRLLPLTVALQPCKDDERRARS